MKIYFASDFHLKLNPTNSADKIRFQKVLTFFDSLQKRADMLFLAGDIFDIWFDWKHVILKEYFPIYYALKKLKESGCRIIFIPGNHDFLLNGFLNRYLGLEIYQDSFSQKLDGKNIFVSHGDGFTKNK